MRSSKNRHDTTTTASFPKGAPAYPNNIPAVPLPNPGEGGPVAPGPALPNPEGPGPVIPGDNTPIAPLPNPGEGGPVNPGNPTPVIPLPNPGEGGPVYPGGPIYPGRPGIIIPDNPLSNPPCFFCDTDQFAKVRFLNAAYGYQPFRIFINNQFVFGGLGFSSLSTYGRISSGFQKITVAGNDGYIYLEKSLPFNTDSVSTVAIINTPNGIDLMQISDAPCNRPTNLSCIRACNLAFNSNPLDVLLYSGRIIFNDVRYKEVTAYRLIQPGQYEFFITESSVQPLAYMETSDSLDNNVVSVSLPEALVSFYIDVKVSAMYTIYILGRNDSPTAIQTLIAETKI